MRQLQLGFAGAAHPSLVRRYIAFFPFWFVNMTCALLDVGFPTFLLTTAVATVPGAVIYTMAGAWGSVARAPIVAGRLRAIAAAQR